MRRRMFWVLVVTVVLVVAVVFGCDWVVAHNARGRLFEDVESVPQCRVGLVLGTSPVSKWTGRRNIYYDCRMQAAADLVKAGKVDCLIVSGGDYRRSEEGGFDEPVAMRDSLISMGVDSAFIVLDYDGTRTINSIANVKTKYCADSIVIISQQYHNERALFLADHFGVDAVALNARTPHHTRTWIRNRCREYLSRVKLFIDILFAD